MNRIAEIIMLSPGDFSFCQPGKNILSVNAEEIGETLRVS